MVFEPRICPVSCLAILTVVADKLRLKYPLHHFYVLHYLPNYSLELIALGADFWGGCWLSPTIRYTKNKIFKPLFSLDTGIFSLTRIPLVSQLWSTALWCMGIWSRFKLLFRLNYTQITEFRLVWSEPPPRKECFSAPTIDHSQWSTPLEQPLHIQRSSSSTDSNI